VGEKVLFPILLVIFLGGGSLALLAEMNGVDTSAPGLAFVLILLLWTYRRGKKNS